MIVLLCLLLPLLTGCSQGVAPRIMYTAVIEKIDDLEGDHYLPTTGQKPLIRLQLHLKGLVNDRDTLDVLVLDLYRPKIYGEVGDTVSFGYFRTLPVNRELWFEQLNEYGIVHKKPANR